MSEPERPDPDALLAQLQQEAAQARRGSLKIFFGASAGVGKTYALLSAAHAARAQGTPVTIGVVETHGRPDTEALARGLPRLPLKAVPYKGHQLQAFDLDAALAFGQQHGHALVLLDELAHSNLAGSRHPKRWQDAEELLAAGIDVWSTMNVQHLESLNDIVSGITGIRVWETVPDRFFDEADEVVVVDLPPDELLQRLKAGKVYLPQGDDQRAERAAWEMARALDLSMVVVLPSAMIGPNAARLTDSMGFIESIRRRQVPLDPGFHFNFVDVRDVAEGMILAAQKGRSGQRYILANERSSSLAQIIEAANAVVPGYRLPPPAPRWLLWAVAWAQEGWARVSGRPAQLIRSQVRMFHGVAQEYRIDKARDELGFAPRAPEEALRGVFGYLGDR